MATGEVRQELVPLYEWNMNVPIMVYDGKHYYPVRLLCAVLGIKAQMQLERMREHMVLSRLLRQFPVRTKTGVRDTWCIEERGIGFWLGSIQIAAVREDVRPRILEFQEALVDAAHRLLTGDAHPNSDTARFALALERRIGRLEERVFDPDSEGE